MQQMAQRKSANNAARRPKFLAASAIAAAFALTGTAFLVPDAVPAAAADARLLAFLGLLVSAALCAGLTAGLLVPRLIGRPAVDGRAAPGPVSDRIDRPDAFPGLQDALNTISDGFILWDENDRLLMHNRPSELRDRPDAVPLTPGMSFRDYIVASFPLVDSRMAGRKLEDWVATREAWHAEAEGSHEIPMRSGRWTLITERRTGDGVTVTIYTDITERKKAEHLLVQSERRLAHAQRLAHVGTWEWDARTGETYWSDIMYDIVGLPPGSPPLDLEQYCLLVHPSHRDLLRSTYRRLIRSGGQYNQEYQIIRPDGEGRTIRTEAEAIVDETGRPVRVIGAVHDLTDLKRAERALRNAKEAADQANRTKSEFLANVSHELRTPLNAILGFSEVMLQEVFGPIGSERYREYAADIQQSGTHLLSVINDLLDYSKLEAGRLELHIETVAIADVIEKGLRLVREQAEAKAIVLVSRPPRFTVEIAADERKVLQIVLNLLSNAVKFTPKGGVVTVALEETTEFVEIAVTDTGIGMSEADIALALAPFGQVDSSLNRQQTGTGLGLPLSRSLAELHGGTLKIESAPGAGTTVRLRLPRAPHSKERPLQLVPAAVAG